MSVLTYFLTGYNEIQKKTSLIWTILKKPYVNLINYGMLYDRMSSSSEEAHDRSHPPGVVAVILQYREESTSR